jgi:amino acid permease
MKLAQMAVNLASLMQVAFSLFPAREQIYIFYKMDRSVKNHLIITMLMVIVSFTVPAVYPNITSILGLVGGLMMGTVGYSMPLFLKIVSCWNDAFSPVKLFNYLMLLFILTVQVLSAYVSIFLPPI